MALTRHLQRALPRGYPAAALDCATGLAGARLPAPSQPTILPTPVLSWTCTHGHAPAPHSSTRWGATCRCVVSSERRTRAIVPRLTFLRLRLVFCNRSGCRGQRHQGARRTALESGLISKEKVQHLADEDLRWGTAGVRVHPLTHQLTPCLLLYPPIQVFARDASTLPVTYTNRGEAVQVDPMKPTLKAPGTKRLKLKCDVLHPNFAFNFKLRRYTGAAGGARPSGPHPHPLLCPTLNFLF